jgi:hypothetical protein
MKPGDERFILPGGRTPSVLRKRIHGREHTPSMELVGDCFLIHQMQNQTTNQERTQGKVLVPPDLFFVWEDGHHLEIMIKLYGFSGIDQWIVLY